MKQAVCILKLILDAFGGYMTRRKALICQGCNCCSNQCGVIDLDNLPVNPAFILEVLFQVKLDTAFEALHLIKSCALGSNTDWFCRVSSAAGFNRRCCYVYRSQFRRPLAQSVGNIIQDKGIVGAAFFAARPM